METNEAQQLTAQLHHLQSQQERMKIVNQAHIAFLKDSSALKNFPGLTAEDIEQVQNYQPGRWDSPHPFSPAELQQGADQILRLKKRLADLAVTPLRAGKAETTCEAFAGGKVVYNTQADRVQIFLDQPPSDPIKALLKGRAFRFVKAVGAWQRNLTANGRAAAAYVISRLSQML